jgi:alanine racemase
VTLGRRREPFLGIISMDLSAVACSAKVQPGQAAQWLGPGVDLWELARLAESVPYELLTSVGARVERIYGA